MKHLIFLFCLTLFAFSNIFAQSDLKPIENNYGPLGTESGIYVYVNKVNAGTSFYMYERGELYMTVIVFPDATLYEIIGTYETFGYKLTSLGDNTATMTICFDSGACIKVEMIAYRNVVINYLTTW